MSLPKELPRYEELSATFTVDSDGVLYKNGVKCATTLSICNRYLSVRYNGSFYKQHRIIMSLYLGRCILPEEIVDHISGETTDNRKGNLRVCDYSQNSRNQKLFTTNKTGTAGVSYLMNTDGHDYYRAQWYDDSTGKRRNRSFSINKYGSAKALELAKAQVKENDAVAGNYIRRK
jgi:hypothetical protein